nr:unnamed protein product [Callosobruchus analis]
MQDSQLNESMQSLADEQASGDSFISLSYLFKMSNQVISDIVHEVCQAIITELSEEIKICTLVWTFLNLMKCILNIFFQ